MTAALARAALQAYGRAYIAMLTAAALCGVRTDDMVADVVVVVTEAGVLLDGL